MLKLYLYVTTLVIIRSHVEVSSSSMRSIDDENCTNNEKCIEKVFNHTDSFFPGKTTKDDGNSTVLMKMATMCDTPNGDAGVCVGILQCEKLLNQLSNLKARQFLRDSMCGPHNEDAKNPRVCCGRFDNYSNDSKLIVDNDDIFPKKCGKQRMSMSSRIIGGTEAKLGEFPWMARLVHKNNHGFKSVGCSGFLIHPKYVLTAAHCVDDGFVEIRGPLYSVILGEHNSKSKIDCDFFNRTCAGPLQISRAAKVILHSEYDHQTPAHYNDIALVYLNKGAKLTEYIQPICLLADPNAVPEEYSLSGWGKTSDDQSMSPVKMKVEIPSVNKSKCDDVYSTMDIHLADTQICAGGEQDKDSCNGDSGGPLMMTSTADVDSDRWYAAGIVSFGIGCGVEGWPGVYTNIPKYLTWIRRKIVETNLVALKGPVKGKKKNHNRRRRIQ